MSFYQLKKRRFNELFFVNLFISWAKKEGSLGPFKKYVLNFWTFFDPPLPPCDNL